MVQLFVNSIPKSGTHMLSRLLDLLGLQLKPGMTLNSWDAEYHPNGVSFHPDGTILSKPGEVPLVGTMCGFSSKDTFSAMLERKFGNTALPYYGYGHHLWSEDSAACFRERNTKMVLIVRDPRAVAVSHAHWVVNPQATHGLFEDYRDLSMRDRLRYEFFGYPESGEAAYSKLIPLIHRFRNIRWWSHHDFVHITTFESLIGAAGGGDPVDQANEIARICDFIGIAKPLDLDWINERLVGNTATFRLGTINGWRRYEEDMPTEAAADIQEMLAILNGLREGKDRRVFAV